MAGPGGREVGRVSVRVVPSTDGFRDKVKSFLGGLEKSLKLEVELDIDKRSLGKLAGKLPTLTQKVRGDTSRVRDDVERMRAQVAGLEAKLRVTANTTAGLREAYALKTRIDRMRAEIEVKVKTDKRGLGGLGGSNELQAMSGVLGGLFAAGSKLPGLLGSIGSSFGTAASFGAKFSSMIGELVGGLGGMLPMLGKVAGPIGAVVAAVVGTGTAVVGAGAKIAGFSVVLGGLLFALGGVGAAVSGLPALLFGLGGAAGVAYLGLDGIKKAAQAAKPALDLLKSQVSAVFTRELTPAFEAVARMLPRLRTGFETAALGVSNFVNSLLGVFTSTQGINDLQRVLTGVDVLVRNMTPGVTGLVQSLLRAGAVTGIYREIGELVNGLSLQFAGLFDRFAEGGESSLMVRAFAQLKEVVLAASGAFLELLLGATEFFTAAGPGVKDFFVSLKNVIEKIDFKSLGESFGTFARTVGQLFERVPQSVWDSLVKSIGDLATKFKELADNPDVQLFFSGLIGTVPLLIGAFAGFVDFLSGVATKIREVVDWNLNLIQRVKDVATSIKNFFTGGADAAEAGNGRMSTSTSTSWGSISRTIGEKTGQALSAVKGWIARQGQIVLNAGLTVAAAVRDGWNRAVAATKQKITEAVNAVRQLPGKAKAALGNLGSMLLASGKALIDGFIRGIKSMGSAVASAARGIVAKARDYFPFSPAKTGPFSGSGWVDRSGEAVGTAFSQGMLRKRLQVANAAATLMSSAQLFDSVRAAAAGRAHADAYRAAIEGTAEATSRAISAAVSKVDPLSGSVTVGAEDGVSAVDLLQQLVESQRDLHEALTERGLPLDTRRGELVARLAQRGAQKLGQL